MGKTVVLVVVFIIFSLALVSAAYAGYSGVGLIQTGGGRRLALGVSAGRWSLAVGRIVVSEPTALDLQPITRRERATLLVSVLIISICALIYELIVGTLSSYLLGDSVTQFSITIGLFLFAMGVGALLSRRIQANELRWFIIIELLTGLFGGSAAAILYATYSVGFAYYYPVMIAVIFAIGICVGLEIPLLTRIVATRANLGHALADILSIDYIGALIGSLAFPIILLPLLGVNQTGFLTGLFNVGVGALILYTFRERLSIRALRNLSLGAGAISLLMIAGVAFSAWWVNVFEQQLYGDLIVYREQSTYQRLVITRNERDTRLYLKYPPVPEW